MADTTRLSASLADRYRIERALGQGGMATVYLAEDLKHNRQVAIKVLKPELAAVLGAERFVQEIKTTAALQHPHILPLFDSGSADGFLYYVMPYVEGETLRDKLDREHQLGVEEAVKITTEVADALDYAHRHGVIHRDIKPENILLHDGRPMVADFGIALAVSAAAGGRMTETGLSLGTPHYMSPEQATAEKEITARSDVYSLASVLYEMLAGQPPHLGGSAQQIIMKIIAEDVKPVTEFRKAVPPNVAAATAKALEKLPADRFQTARDFAEALADPGYRTTTAAAAGAPAALRSSRLVAPLAAVTILAIGLAAWGWLRRRPELPVIRYGLALPAGQGMLPNSPIPEVAPDGSFLVYFGPVPGTSAAQQLWLKRRDSYAARPIPGTMAALNVAISPDSRSIAFTALNQLKTLLLAGGTPVTLADSAAAGFTLAWLDDGEIAYSTVGATSELRRIPASGGRSILISRSDSLASRYPVALPGSRNLLFSRCSPGADCTEWAYDARRDTAYALAGRSPTQLGSARTQYAESGYLLFFKDGALVAAPFDPDRLAITGLAVVLADSVRDFSLSRSGTLVLRTGESGAAGPDYQLVWVDRTGRGSPVDTSFTFRLNTYTTNHGWALSPDGRRLAIGLHGREGDDLWLKPLPRGAASRITYAPTAEFRPRWTPDGRSVIFGSNRVPYGIYQRRADGTGSDSLLVKADFVVQEAVLTGDGAWLLARLGGSAGPGGRDIVGLQIGRDTALKSLLATRFDEDAIAPSPDGHWLAYQSDETGEIEVFVRSFPDVERLKRQVSSGGGVAPLWSRDGRELFYLSAGNDMMSVRVTAGATLTLGNPAKLFHVPDDLLQVETAYYTPWDVAPDGRFIMVRAIGAPEESTSTIVVVENFLQELKERLRR